MKGLILLAQLTCSAMPLPNGGCQWCCESETVQACRHMDRCETKQEEKERREYNLEVQKNQLEILKEKNKAEALKIRSKEENQVQNPHEPTPY